MKRPAYTLISGHLILYPAISRSTTSCRYVIVISALSIHYVCSFPQFCESDIPYPYCIEAKAVANACSIVKEIKFLCSSLTNDQQTPKFERSVLATLMLLLEKDKRKIRLRNPYQSIHIEITLQDTFLEGIWLFSNGLWWGGRRNRGSGRRWCITNALSPLMRRYMESLIIRGRD